MDLAMPDAWGSLIAGSYLKEAVGQQVTGVLIRAITDGRLGDGALKSTAHARIDTWMPGESEKGWWGALGVVSVACVASQKAPMAAVCRCHVPLDFLQVSPFDLVPIRRNCWCWWRAKVFVRFFTILGLERGAIRVMIATYIELRDVGWSATKSSFPMCATRRTWKKQTRALCRPFLHVYRVLSTNAWYQTL